jgi:hypothetical protein
MRAKYFVVGGAVLAVAVRGIAACSFGPDAYTGPDPLTPEEAGIEGGDDGSTSGDDGSSNESSNGDGGVSEDGPLHEGATDGSRPESGAVDGGAPEGSPQEDGASDGKSEGASDSSALSDTSDATG